MPQFTMEVEMNNAAFEAEGGRRELVLILKTLAERLSNTISLPEEWDAKLSDHNGNKVGFAAITTTASEDAEKDRQVVGYVIVDDEGTVQSDPEEDMFAARREAESWNESSAEDFCGEKGQTAEEYKAAGRIGGFWPIYSVKALDAAGETHDPEDTIQLGDKVEVYKGK